MRTKADTLKIVEGLKNIYPDTLCNLEYEEPWHLMVAVRLSAQCTDARVNKITPILFEKYPTLEALAGADAADIEAIVKPCGLGKSKARDIHAASNILLRVYGGVMPQTMEQLLELPGVGRKSANLILGDIFNVPGVVIADTHCIRIANRLGFVSSKDPLKVENALRKVLPPLESNNFCHRCVLHGRAVCTSRTAHCEICALSSLCPKKGVAWGPD